MGEGKGATDQIREHSDNSKRGSYCLGRWLFLRLLAVVYLIAFLSLWVQVDGLVGADGILPVHHFLDLVRANLGAERFWRVPTLLWLGDSDFALHLLCGSGTVLSLLLLAGVAPLMVLALLWACYLSLTIGGQTFLSFQWDTLLLETGFCALFLAPASWRPAGPFRLGRPPRAGLWLLWLLLFKLMFLSGAVKPLSFDRTWLQLTALDYHFWTQPLPTWTAWYANQLPDWVRMLSVYLTYTIEIALPFCVFAGPLGRRTVAAGTIFLMLMISWTGNYGFFNLLTIVLCVPLVDDAAWPRGLLEALRAPTSARVSSRRFGDVLRVVAVALLITISSLTLVRELVRTVPRDAGSAASATHVADRWLLSWSEPTVLRWIAPLRTINGYGLFRAMTTERREIVIEGSRDGTHWIAYELPWKPGALNRRPRFVAPHMPRLDWQMWFAALGPRAAWPWLEGLLGGILRGSPDVIGLFDSDPFEGSPPRYVRLVYYDYHFATPSERRKGLWWSREPLGMLTAPLTLEQLQDQ